MKQDWLDVEDCEDVDEMVKAFDKNIKAALDLASPLKSFKIRSNYRFGLSENTKELMKKRDKTRNAIKNAAKKEKGVLLKQYKSLRNKVTSKICKENKYTFNSFIHSFNEAWLGSHGLGLDDVECVCVVGKVKWQKRQMYCKGVNNSAAI